MRNVNLFLQVDILLLVYYSLRALVENCCRNMSTLFSMNHSIGLSSVAVAAIVVTSP